MIGCTACKVVAPCSHGNCNCTCLPKEMYYNCSCNEGYTGVNCDQDINECMNGSIPSNICGDNGTCWNTNGSFRCEVSVSTFLMRLQQSLSLSCIDVYHLINSTLFSRLFALFHSLVTCPPLCSRDHLVCSHDSLVCSHDSLVCSRHCLVLHAII